ncbi:hypothetical protein GC175_28575 [bacterium]|nr:hypothetical protein [bacterium]
MHINSVYRLFEYNEWAWQRVFPSLAAIPEAAYFEERPFFWGSLHKVAVHCYSAEWIWRQRILGSAPAAMVDPSKIGSLAELRERWDPLRAEWRSWVTTLNESDLAQIFHFRDTLGTPYNCSLNDLLHHLINHGTEHRSQITPIVYPLGFPTEPLDYIYFVRQTE